MQKHNYSENRFFTCWLQTSCGFFHLKQKTTALQVSAVSMHLTFLTSWEDDRIHFVEAKENITIFLYPRAAAWPLWIIQP